MTANAITDRAIVYVVIIIATTILCSAGYGLVQSVQPVHAAPVAKQQEPGTCIKFATVGSFDQYHCVDPTGNEYDTNTAGFMVYPGN